MLIDNKNTLFDFFIVQLFIHRRAPLRQEDYSTFLYCTIFQIKPQ